MHMYNHSELAGSGISLEPRVHKGALWEYEIEKIQYGAIRIPVRVTKDSEKALIQNIVKSWPRHQEVVKPWKATENKTGAKYWNITFFQGVVGLYCLFYFTLYCTLQKNLQDYFIAPTVRDIFTFVGFCIICFLKLYFLYKFIYK